MKSYGFYSRADNTKEVISKTLSTSRLRAAEYFAKKKAMTLKSFLKIYTITK
jgi:hypothetical protein